MTILGFGALVSILGSGMFAMYTNRDYFSPAKFFLGYLTLFHFQLVLIPSPLEQYLTFFCFLVIALIFIVYEKSVYKSIRPKGHTFIETERISKILVLLVWVISMIPIILQIFFILSSGGIIQYINDSIYRATLWRGKGYLLILIQWMQVLNIIYFCIGLYFSKKSKFWWSIFGLHFLISLSFGVLTASRTVMLLNFLIMLICYHYIKKPISFKYFLTTAISILIVASAIGLARNNFKIEDGILTTGFTAERSNSTKVNTLTSTFKYGLIPLDYIYEKPPPKLQYGSSLLTIVTNVVPRDIWESKPDTSSMAMNKIYIEDKGPGPYEYPAGVLGLGVMNFGWMIGILFGYLLTIIFLMYAEVLYKRNLLPFHSQTSISLMLKLIMSIYFIQTVPAIVPGEFTNVLHSLLLTKVAPILIFMIFYKLLSKKYKRMNLEKIY